MWNISASVSDEISPTELQVVWYVEKNKFVIGQPPVLRERASVVFLKRGMTTSLLGSETLKGRRSFRNCNFCANRGSVAGSYLH